MAFKSTRKASLVFWLFLLTVALLLRVGGLRYGLPYLYHPDEPTNIQVSLNLLQNGSLKPDYYFYPSLLFYLNSFVLSIYYKVGLFLNIFSSVHDLPRIEIVHLGMGIVSKPSMILVCRGLSAIISWLGVVVCLECSHYLFNEWYNKLIALVCIIFSPLVLWVSHFAVPDVLLLFFNTALIFFALFIFEKGFLRYYLGAGILLGLAISSKYNAVIFAVTILIAHGFRVGFKRIFNWSIFFAFLTCVLTWLVLNPYSIIDRENFWEQAIGIVTHYATANQTKEMGNLGFAGWQYLKLLWKDVGVFLILAGIGVFTCIQKRSFKLILISITVLTYFSVISLMAINTRQTLVPIIPLIGLLASAGWGFLWKMTTKGNLVRISLVLLVAIQTILMGYNSVKMVINYSVPDGREYARVWINDNITAGARIALESYSPLIDTSQFKVQYMRRMIDQTIIQYREQGVDYLVFSQGMFGRYFREPNLYENEVSRYKLLFSELELLKTFDQAEYEIKIYKISD